MKVQTPLPTSKPAVSAIVTPTTLVYPLRIFRWVVSTIWFLYLLAALLVGVSFAVSLHTDTWHWFQRSGAIMVSIGALLSTQNALRTMLDGVLRELGAKSGKVSQWSESGELKTCVCGFAFVAIGTLIWAYGDLFGCLLHLDSSCLT